METRRSTRGPAPAHSRASIAAAAVAIADSSGLAAVTMRTIAGRLGTGPGSLYRYVTSRDDLLDLMVDAAMSERDAQPAPPAWLDGVLALARSLRAVYRRHPWLAEVRQATSVPGPHAIDYFEECLSALEDAPGSSAAKMEAAALINGIVTLFAKQEAGSTTVELSADDPDRWPRLSAALTGAPPDATPRQDLFDRVIVGTVQGILGPAS